MGDSEKRAYRLYALAVSKQAVDEAMKQRFSRILPEYILIYTQEVARNGWVEVGEENLYRLTKEDSDWVMQCAAALFLERLKQSGFEVSKRLGEMVDKLSAALDEERKKLSSNKEEKAHGDTERGTEQGPV